MRWIGCLGCWWIWTVALVAQPNRILHLKIDEEIDVRAERHLELALEAAIDQEAELVILELNTFGGSLGEADEMRQQLLSFSLPVYVLINKNAASAGALISIACDSIYMSSGASIGAATVVEATGAVAPDKYQSYMRGLMRSTAETQNRDPLLAEAMVDPDVEVDSLAPRGKVLTLTTQQAIKYGFCEAEVRDLSSLLSYLNAEQAELIHFQRTLTERVIAFFMNPAISSVLILLIIWGIYAELQSPGIGLAGAVAVVAAALYLIPYYLNGVAEYWEIVLLFLGLGLVVVEVLFVPGFGLIGIAGAGIVLASLVLIMVNNNGFDFSWVSPSEITNALVAVLVALVGGVVAAWLLGRKLLESRAFLRLTLPNNMSASEGFRIQGGNPGAESLVGKRGRAYSVLRPSGKVEIRGKIYEATVDTGDFLDEDTEIIVCSEEGRELRVAPLRHQRKK